MIGRNGMDALNRFIVVISAFFAILGIIADDAGKATLNSVALIFIWIAIFRMFSRNLARRSDENNRYTKAKYRLFSKLKNIKERWVQRKDYKFFVCPNCRATLRVPRGRGKIKIVCRKCGNSFIGKS